MSPSIFAPAFDITATTALSAGQAHHSVPTDPASLQRATSHFWSASTPLTSSRLASAVAGVLAQQDHCRMPHKGKLTWQHSRIRSFADHLCGSTKQNRFPPISELNIKSYYSPISLHMVSVLQEFGLHAIDNIFALQSALEIRRLTAMTGNTMEKAGFFSNESEWMSNR